MLLVQDHMHSQIPQERATYQAQYQTKCVRTAILPKAVLYDSRDGKGSAKRTSVAEQTTSHEEPIGLLFACERADNKAHSSGCSAVADVGISCADR